MLVLAFVTALLASSRLVGSAPTGEAWSGPPGLDDFARLNGKLYFGTATDNGSPSWEDPKYLSVLGETYNFGQLTAGNLMKWEYTEPSRGVFNFTGGDQLVSYAKAHHRILRCHNLVWYNQLPDWLTSGTWDNSTLISILQTHITNLVTHWASDCYAWDVVNEALNDDGTWRATPFYNVIGPEYVPLAFKFAAEAALAAGHPNIKLYYNDYNIEYPGAKSTAAANIVKMLQSRGLKIDGVGLQSHFLVDETPSRDTQIANMESFTSLGVDVAVTELDVRFENATQGSTSNATAQALQANDYEETVSACRNVARCVGITIWDFTDKYSWIPGVFTGQGAALPWDENINVKPVVYDGIVKGLFER